MVGEPRPIAVRVHLHLVMTGAFPLRVADLFFTPIELIVAEYEYLTPLFGLARGGASSAGEAAKNRYAESGVEGVLEMAEETFQVPYEDVECIRVYESDVGRPKIAVGVEGNTPYAYRIHAPVDLDALTDALRSLADGRGFSVARHSSLGFSPLNSLRRFLSGR